MAAVFEWMLVRLFFFRFPTVSIRQLLLDPINVACLLILAIKRKHPCYYEHATKQDLDCTILFVKVPFTVRGSYIEYPFPPHHLQLRLFTINLKLTACDFRSIWNGALSLALSTNVIVTVRCTGKSPVPSNVLSMFARASLANPGSPLSAGLYNGRFIARLGPNAQSCQVVLHTSRHTRLWVSKYPPT